EAPGGRHDRLVDPIHDRRGRAGAKSFEQRIERAPRTFRDTAHRTARGVRDPALEPEGGRLAQDVVAEPDALHAPDHGRVEPDSFAHRRVAAPRRAHAARCRPGQPRTTESRMSSGETFASSSSAAIATRSRKATAAPGGIASAV